LSFVLRTIKSYERPTTFPCRFLRTFSATLHHQESGQDIEMETEKICAELDRQGVTGHFKIRGELEEIGPHGWPWTHTPIPGAVTAAIERIRADITSENYAKKRHSLLSSNANDRHRRARAATQGS
jgi:hypothetical protein